MAEANTQSRWRRLIISRGAWIRLGVGLGLLVLLGAIGWFVMFSMPGSSYDGPIPSLDEEQQALAESLESDVRTLAGEIGERHVGNPDQLHAAEQCLADALRAAGYDVERQAYDAEIVTGDHIRCANVIAELPGGDAADEIVVVGAHYDTVFPSPGANDNASGVAATLTLARRFADAAPERTVRFVLFVNEEPGFFQSEDMGSLVYARRCRDRGDDIIAMLALETIGYYSDKPGSQAYPFGLGAVYPDTGNFISFVSNVSSRGLLRDVVRSFREVARVPSEGGAMPGSIPGVGWSDHWSFWQVGYPALMVTDTAPFRYPNYHSAADTPDKLDYQRMTLVVEGLAHVVADLAGIE